MKKIECSYCGKEAGWETPVGNIHLCNRDECKIQFCDDQCEPLEESES